MEINEFKQHLYDHVLWVSNIKPSKVVNINSINDTVIIEKINGKRIILSIYEDEEIDTESDMDIGQY